MLRLSYGGKPSCGYHHNRILNVVTDDGDHFTVGGHGLTQIFHQSHCVTSIYRQRIPARIVVFVSSPAERGKNDNLHGSEPLDAKCGYYSIGFLEIKGGKLTFEWKILTCANGK